MHPAFSVIFFTVSSGAGFGLFALLYLADVMKLGGGLSGEQVVATGAMALVFIIAAVLVARRYPSADSRATRTLVSARSGKRAAQVGVNDSGIALHRRRCAFGYFPAVVEHGDAVA